MTGGQDVSDYDAGKQQNRSRVRVARQQKDQLAWWRCDGINGQRAREGPTPSA